MSRSVHITKKNFKGLTVKEIDEQGNDPASELNEWIAKTVIKKEVKKSRKKIRTAIIRLEHSIQLFYNIENSNFFVMPGATHYGSVEKPELFNMVLLDFLTRPFSKLSSVELMTRKH